MRACANLEVLNTEFCFGSSQCSVPSSGRCLSLFNTEVKFNLGLITHVVGRTVASDPVVELPSFKIGHNLRSCGGCVEGRVGLVFKLPRKEPAVLVGELSSLSQIKVYTI